MYYREQRRDQPVREADRRRAGDHGPRRSRRAAGDRHRRRAAAIADQRIRRGERRRPLRIARADEADRDQPAARRQLHRRRQFRRVAEVALPRSLRAPGRYRDLARHLRRAPRDVPGLAGRDLRALPGPGRQLVLPDVHGRRRIRLRPPVVAAAAGPRRPAERRAARRARVGRDSGSGDCPSCRCRCRRWSASSSG